MTRLLLSVLTSAILLSRGASSVHQQWAFLQPPTIQTYVPYPALWQHQNLITKPTIFAPAENQWTPIVHDFYHHPPSVVVNNIHKGGSLKNHRLPPDYNPKKQPKRKKYRQVDKNHRNEPSTYSVHQHSETSQGDDNPEVPTKPIYSGEGKWAQRGNIVRHPPSEVKIPPKDHEEEEDSASEEEEAEPEGVELFHKKQQLFDKNRARFAHNFPDTPQQSSEDLLDENEDEEPEFTPIRLYAQVRRTEDEEHLSPDEAPEARLREVVKDSKIQTVYTEEGYEDAAYDHAGHERNAEEDEGFAEFDKEIHRPKKNKSTGKDIDTAFSGFEPIKQDLLTVQQTSTTMVKDNKGGGAEMEVTSEVKTVASPHNSTKTHKFVKIFPKVFQLRKRRSLKYPFYDSKDVNPDSPLRYSEDPRNIPEKDKDDLAFYHQADRKVECQEVETDVDPIPDRVKNPSNDSSSEEEASTEEKTRRLGNLGDKIDCFKAKYFGENPLDSPFFEEKTVAPVSPLFPSVFNSKQYIKTRQVDKKPLTVIISKTSKRENPDHNTTIQNSGLQLKIVTTPPPLLIITTPKYTIDLKPKHIYDQIALLNHLPKYDPSTNTSETRVAKNLVDTQSDEDTVNPATIEPSPESLPLVRRRYRPSRFNHPMGGPHLYIELTTPKTITTTTVSEVHYKNDIRPSEQMNVFQDVLNNIKSDRGPYLFTTTTTTDTPRGKTRFTHPLHVKTTTTDKPEDTDIAPTELEDDQQTFVSLPKVPQVTPKKKKVVMNNFYVIGMKPPPPVLYVTKFKVPPPKRRYTIVRHKFRAKRSPQRPTYSTVSRNRNRPIDADSEEVAVVTPAEEEDDYVPHRPTNYHYDEKTKRIVYDKTDKPAEEELEEVVEEVVSEAPIPLPTRRNKPATTNLFANVKPTGPTYVDFLQKLRSDPNYKLIPDPTTTTTEKTDTTSTTTVSTTQATKQPEFLSILHKVRDDSSYKQIEDEDPKKSKNPAKEAEVVQDEPEDDAEVQEAQVQNSPGGQHLGTSNFQIFDISEYLPKVKTYTPRTPIDYSKYKTIERPSTRHNLSSRFNAQSEEIQDVKTVRVPILHLEDTQPSSETPQIVPSTAETLTTRRTRGKITTRRPMTTTTTEQPVQEPQEKLKRNYLRRRPVRIKLSTTASPQPTLENRMDKLDDLEDVNKERESQIVAAVTTIDNKSPQELKDERTRRIVERYNKLRNRGKVTTTDNHGQASKRIEAREIKGDVEVFQKYDKEKKHGGNYKKEEDVEEEEKESSVDESKNVPKIEETTTRLTDVVLKPVAFFTDPKLPDNVNHLMESSSASSLGDEEFDEDISNDGNNSASEDSHEVKGESGEEEFSDEQLDDEINNSTTTTTTTTVKVPVFIKDPNKRLYYYAPV